MPKRIPSHDLTALLEAITAFPEGASLHEIMGALDHVPPRRTLQRHLLVLIRRGLLQAEGNTRGRRYKIPAIEKPSFPRVLRESPIPLSPEAEEIYFKVSQPIQKRTPAAYNREFLDSYRPNETYYLPAATRQRLLELGKSPDGKRPAGTYARQILQRLLIDLAWNSSRLEGNTYSLLDTQELLRKGKASEDKDPKETQMILNHKAAIEFLVESIDLLAFNRYTILNLHALLANYLIDAQSCGRLRQIPVGIAHTVYHPLAVPQLINECFEQVLFTASAIRDPFEQAFFVMVHLPYLQPFEDVNKRVSRLAANLPFIRDNLSPLSFVDVPEDLYIDGILGVYELNQIELLRDVFVWAYERSCLIYSAARKTLGQPDPFRMRHRQLIFEVVAKVVRDRLNKKQAQALIKQRALESLPSNERARFTEVIETELMALHEGNIARYRLRPSEYEAWRQTWK